MTRLTDNQRTGPFCHREDNQEKADLIGILYNQKQVAPGFPTPAAQILSLAANPQPIVGLLKPTETPKHIQPEQSLWLKVEIVFRQHFEEVCKQLKIYDNISQLILAFPDQAALNWLSWQKFEGKRNVIAKPIWSSPVFQYTQSSGCCATSAQSNSNPSTLQLTVRCHHYQIAWKRWDHPPKFSRFQANSVSSPRVLKDQSPSRWTKTDLPR